MNARGARALSVGLAGALLWSLGAVGASAQEHEAPGGTIMLSWDGSEFVSSTTEHFVGAPVAVPGDTAERTLFVRNDGTLEGTLTATIVNVELLDPDAEDVHHNPEHTAPDDSGDYAGAGEQGDFYDDLRISWLAGDASASDLFAQGETEVLRTTVGPGETVPVTIGYELPFEATSGNQANVDPRLLTFDVRIDLGGDLPVVTPEPSAPTPSEPSARPQLPRTGAAELGWLVLIAGLLAASGAVLSLRRKGARTLP